MNDTGSGELVWTRSGGQICLTVHASSVMRRRLARAIDTDSVRVANVDVRFGSGDEKAVFRHPIQLEVRDRTLVGGPVFAILAGSGHKVFHGNRAEYRDLLQTARAEQKFVYVLPASSVSDESMWQGYVRIGAGRWLGLPCPRPEAVYNRIPTRNLERTPVGEAARKRLMTFEIPMFNPSYFNKAELYQLIAGTHMARYLPETSSDFSKHQLHTMLRRHRSVYLKPSGGSVGHGMILVSTEEDGYRLSVLKGTSCRNFFAPGYDVLWKAVGQHRLPGTYVLQAAKPLIQWEDRTCDFRVLLQKHQGEWNVIGTGVRVAGDGAITTHVPNGGYIAAAEPVIRKWFGARAEVVEHELHEAVVEIARIIDRHFALALGEMSMDIGVDPSGGIWFFEANSKPMKFDEPDIRERSLYGVLAHLQELRAARLIDQK